MPIVQLNFKSLADLDDGRIATAFEHEIKRAVQDCYDRPSDKKPRTITLEFQLTPITENNGGVVETEGCHGEFKIKSKVPERRSKTYEFKANKQGHLSFSSNSPDNHDQTTIFDERDATGKVTRPDA